MSVPVLLLVLRKRTQKNQKTILVNQQNCTTNVITELLRYIVTGQQTWPNGQGIPI